MSKADTNLCERRDKLKASLKHAYTSAKIASKASHKNNKKYYDQRAKPRSFEVADFVYLFNKARKPGLSKKFHRVWTGPCQITTKISDLNYEIIGKNGRKQVVHVNRLKPAHGFHAQASKPRPRHERMTRSHSVTSQASDEMAAIKASPLPITVEAPRQDGAPPNQKSSSSLDPASPVHLDSPRSERIDPTYRPDDSPRSRRERQNTRPEPPITRSKARITSQDHADHAPPQGNTSDQTNE